MLLWQVTQRSSQNQFYFFHLNSSEQGVVTEGVQGQHPLCSSWHSRYHSRHKGNISPALCLPVSMIYGGTQEVNKPFLPSEMVLNYYSVSKRAAGLAVLSGSFGSSVGELPPGLSQLAVVPGSRFPSPWLCFAFPVSLPKHQCFYWAFQTVVWPSQRDIQGASKDSHSRESVFPCYFSMFCYTNHHLVTMHEAHASDQNKHWVENQHF